ncbi:hypothetical protein D3C75_1109420 [compost metagenome]
MGVLLAECAADGIAHILRIEEFANPVQGAQHGRIDLGLLFYGNAHGVNNCQRAVFQLQILADFVKITCGVHQHDAVSGQTAYDVDRFVQLLMENTDNMRHLNGAMVADLHFRLRKTDEGFDGRTLLLGTVRGKVGAV